MKLIHPATSSSSELLHKPGLTLPAELVDKGVARLSLIAGIIAVATVTVAWLDGYFQPEVALANQASWGRLFGLSIVLLSGALIALRQSGWVSKRTMLHLGIVFQILVAFLLAMIETAIPFSAQDVVHGVSGVALLIVLCGLAIPSTPLMNLTASVACAASWPLAYLLSIKLYGHAWIGMNRLGAWVFPLLFTAIFTNLLSRYAYRIQIKAGRAEELGSYKLVALIGQGGMGEVWRARHRLLARDAAIKLIRPEILTRHSMRDASIVRRRFEREAQMTAGLRSPHTVALYDFGISSDQSFYYVMELLDGIDLQSLVDRYGPLPAARVRNILVHACSSLEEAHRNGLIHRDVKPRNIFLCRLGLEFDFAKVLDFGLAKTLRAEDATQMTADGTTTGTPAYMAPEIALGAKELDARADIYALGCVAYFLLTGQLVFEEPNAMAIAFAHVQKQPLAPSSRSELPVPPVLDQLVLQCLEKNPAKRPQTAYDLAQRLESLDLPPFSRATTEKWWSTHMPARVEFAANLSTAVGSTAETAA